MHQMKFTNRQIQEMLNSYKQQLRLVKTTTNICEVSFKFPELDRPKAKLVILLKAWLKLQALVTECDKEIAWHGLVTKSENTYTIEDVIIFPQSVTGATVTSDDTEYSLWLAQQPDEIFNKIRFHGHSHVNMGVTPSGVDTAYQEDIVRNLQDFYIFSIFNKKGDNWCTIYDVEDNIVYGDNDIELITPDIEAIGWAQAAIKEFVTFPAQKKKTTGKKTKGNNNDDDDDEYVYGSWGSYLSDYYGGYR